MLVGFHSILTMITKVIGLIFVFMVVAARPQDDQGYDHGHGHAFSSQSIMMNQDEYSPPVHDEFDGQEECDDNWENENLEGGIDHLNQNGYHEDNNRQEEFEQLQQYDYFGENGQPDLNNNYEAPGTSLEKINFQGSYFGDNYFQAFDQHEENGTQVSMDQNVENDHHKKHVHHEKHHKKEQPKKHEEHKPLFHEHAFSSQSVHMHNGHHVPVYYKHEKPAPVHEDKHEKKPEKQYEHHVDYYTHPKYEYEYKVEDHHTGDSKSHHETRHGDDVHGFYSVREPDGTVRIVEYSADKHTGFHANVRHEGFPETH